MDIPAPTFCREEPGKCHSSVFPRGVSRSNPPTRMRELRCLACNAHHTPPPNRIFPPILLREFLRETTIKVCWVNPGKQVVFLWTANKKKNRFQETQSSPCVKWVLARCFAPMQVVSVVHLLCAAILAQSAGRMSGLIGVVAGCQ